MITFKLRHLITKAQKGDKLSRERLLQENRNFVAKVCSNVCNRYLTWENDEELSIGLLALNEAIDAYDTEEKIKFTTFAYTVIKRRLIDYFRSQSKYDNELLTTSTGKMNELEAGITARAITLYNEGKVMEELTILIEHYKLKLSEYDIDIHDLPKFSPKRRATRDSLFKAVFALVENEAMVDYLKRYGQLPIKNLCQSTGLSRKVLEKGRKYIIALAIIMLDPQLTPLRHFNNIVNTGGDRSYE